MSSKLHSYNPEFIPDCSNQRFGIVVAEWNAHITDKLLDGAIETFLANNVKPENIEVAHVPGSFELTFGAKQMINSKKFDAIIVLGCVIKGDTPHFDYVCMGVTQGIAQLNATANVPTIFGMLTVNTEQQALDRCGGSLGNKGSEAAITAIKMANFPCK